MSSPCQTIATYQHNISQHCWTQQVACVWPPCFNALRHVGYWKSKYCACLGATLLRKPGQTTTTSCNIHECCIKILTIFKFKPTKPKKWQHLATPCNRVTKRAQHLAPKNVAICCVEMLRSFGRGLTWLIVGVTWVIFSLTWVIFSLTWVIFTLTRVILSSTWVIFRVIFSVT